MFKPSFLLFFQHLLVRLVVLVVPLQALKILLPVEFFLVFLTLVTTLCGLSDLSVSCPTTLSIL